MGLRGPKSKAELALVASSGGRPTIDAVQRPRPPAGMPSAQKEMWTRIVEDLPADWFRKHNFDLLAQYCRHVDASRKIASLIEAEEGASPDDPGRPFNLHRWAELLALQDRESRALATLATKMRLTQQTSWSEQRGKGAAAAALSERKPWQE